MNNIAMYINDMIVAAISMQANDAHILTHKEIDAVKECQSYGLKAEPLYKMDEEIIRVQCVPNND